MSKRELATLGAGCFWCVEAVFQQIKGVHKVTSGYSGGATKNPSYKEICNGDSGHAEVIQIEFEPTEVSFEELLEVFWKVHDPTTLNRQGADVGTQYRSVIFYHDETQKSVAEKSKNETDHSKLWPDPIVTEITPFQTFYPAENYHQNYFNLNSNQPYCRVVIHPKLQKFQKDFAQKLKS